MGKYSYPYLFVFNDLGHEFSFANQFLSNECVPFHRGNASSDRLEELQAENERITGNYHLTEFHTVDLHEIGGITFRFVYGIEDEQSAGLCHGFHQKHAWHYRLLREMALEERLVDGHILD